MSIGPLDRLTLDDVTTGVGRGLLDEVHGTQMALVVFPARVAAIEAEARLPLRSRLAALEAALRGMMAAGSHSGACGGWPSEDVPCDCGWADAWKAARALLAGEEDR